MSTTATSAAIHALLDGAIDFAGLYPPASLDEPTTVAMHQRLLTGHGSWIGGRLVWPASRLEALGDLAKGLAPTVIPPRTEGAWAISAVTPPVASWEAFNEAIAAVNAFNERHATEGAPAMRVDCLEVKVATAADIDRALDILPECFVYWECAVDRDVRGILTAMAEDGFGAKIRTGGVEASAHPSVDQVAAFIMACARARVPFKATAGLHRALRHDVASIGCRQHGFLNVMVGAALAHAEAVDAAALSRLLADERADAFCFDAKGVSWEGSHAGIGALTDSRARLMHSFGSCSYDEPLQDLLAMGLISKEECA